MVDHDFEGPVADMDIGTLNGPANGGVEGHVFESPLSAVSRTSKDLLHAKTPQELMRFISEKVDNKQEMQDIGDDEVHNTNKNTNKNMITKTMSKNKRGNSQPKSHSAAESITTAWRLVYRRT
ncbi:hypothetical protein BG004_002154, partial [Podila humilis]